MVLFTSLSYADHYEWLLKGCECQIKRNNGHLSTASGRNSAIIGGFSWENQKTVLQFCYWDSSVLICNLLCNVAQWRAHVLVTEGTQFEFLVGPYFLCHFRYILNSSCLISSTVKSR